MDGDRFLIHGRSVFSNIPVSAVWSPVRRTDREDVHMVAGQ